MSTLQDRLARTEKRLKDLTENVASLYRSRIEFLDTHGLDLAKAANIAGVPLATGHQKDLNALSERVRKIEQRLDAVADELGDHIIGHSQNFMASPDTDEQKGLETLAKAREVIVRHATPEGLAKRADKALSDPTAIGIVCGHLAAGDIASAAAIVAKAEDIAAKKEMQGNVGDRVDGQIKEYELLSHVSKLGEQITALQQTLTAVLSRLSKLEARPRAAPAQTVAKAAQGRRQVTNVTDPRDTPEGLTTRLEAVFDSPAQVGMLSSMLQAGKVEEVRQAVERAELAHEADMRKRERRSL